MNILLVTQVFAPDMAANAILSSALSRYLLERGHLVTVLAGPQLDVQDPDVKNLKNADHVYRAPGIYDKRQTLFKRLICFGRLYAAAIGHALIKRDYDVVIVLTEPPMIYLATLLFKLLGGARIVLWSLDCYPEVAVEAGVIKREGIIHKTMRILNRWGYSVLDALIALDEDMALHLQSRGARNVVVIHNWESRKDYTDISRAERQKIRAELGVEEDDIFILYLGNMGVAHEFGTILSVMTEVAQISPKLKLGFIGGGPRKTQIIEHVTRNKIAQIIVKDFVPKKKTQALIGASDLGLVTLRKEMVGLVAPSKIYSYMAMGMPLLFVGPRSSEISCVITKAGCGAVFEPGDPAALRKYLVDLPSGRAELRLQGSRARSFFLNNFESSIILPQFEVLLDRLFSETT